MTEADLKNELAALATLSLAQLRFRWSERITVDTASVGLVLPSAGITELLGLKLRATSPDRITHEVPARLTKTGRAVKLVQDGGMAAVASAPDPALVKLLAKAHR